MASKRDADPHAPPSTRGRVSSVSISEASGIGIDRSPVSKKKREGRVDLVESRGKQVSRAGGSGPHAAAKASFCGPPVRHGPVGARDVTSSGLLRPAASRPAAPAPPDRPPRAAGGASRSASSRGRMSRHLRVDLASAGVCPRRACAPLRGRRLLVGGAGGGVARPGGQRSFHPAPPGAAVCPLTPPLPPPLATAGVSRIRWRAGRRATAGCWSVRRGRAGPQGSETTPRALHVPPLGRGCNAVRQPLCSAQPQFGTASAASSVARPLVHKALRSAHWRTLPIT